MGRKLERLACSLSSVPHTVISPWMRFCAAKGLSWIFAVFCSYMFHVLWIINQKLRPFKKLTNWSTAKTKKRDGGSRESVCMSLIYSICFSCRKLLKLLLLQNKIKILIYCYSEITVCISYLCFSLFLTLIMIFGFVKVEYVKQFSLEVFRSVAFFCFTCQ